MLDTVGGDLLRWRRIVVECPGQPYSSKVPTELGGNRLINTARGF